ncbi:hypothetical protein JAAARDRAFT_197853 [Jaapia argillacea MUCL 33604]|uniref:Ribonuclease H1 N-terminal domain-containing protein n=1 Tax=Jaapia argillacea MUCL 33604 TaxID=933084 RepID=A0A067PGW9_9AGAM|nr:hypothetical protein JAAARDRAFT_197853 [Jaapia argillacea MUCL 33604]
MPSSSTQSDPPKTPTRKAAYTSTSYDTPCYKAIVAALANLSVENSSANMARKNCYVVFCGCKTGIFTVWEEAHCSVSGYPNNCYKGYTTLKEGNAEWSRFVCGANGAPPRDAEHVPLDGTVWVVIKGAVPGVYESNDEAINALGDNPEVRITGATSIDARYALLMREFQAGHAA